MYFKMVSDIKKMLENTADMSVLQAVKKIAPKYYQTWPLKFELAKWFFNNLEHLEGAPIAKLSAQNIDWQ